MNKIFKLFFAGIFIFSTIEVISDDQMEAVCLYTAELLIRNTSGNEIYVKVIPVGSSI